MSGLKIGDIVHAYDYNDYNVTCKECNYIGEVIDVEGGEVTLKTVFRTFFDQPSRIYEGTNPNGINEIYTVRKKTFDLLTSEKLSEIYHRTQMTVRDFNKIKGLIGNQQRLFEVKPKEKNRKKSFSDLLKGVN